jgi:hypothetical protein
MKITILSEKAKTNTNIQYACHSGEVAEAITKNVSLKQSLLTVLQL